jgi:uncharacterized cupin superfamily protein
MKTKTPSAIKASDAPKREGSRYPKPYNEPCMKRSKAILGDVFGLDQFGVNLVTMPPGTWSAQRHWHDREDEFVYVVEGELTLSDDVGDHLLTPGMCAGFKANNGNGHCLKNLTAQSVVYLEVGSRRDNDKVVYSDIDMKAEDVDGEFTFMKKDGTHY